MSAFERNLPSDLEPLLDEYPQIEAHIEHMELDSIEYKDLQLKN